MEGDGNKKSTAPRQRSPEKTPNVDPEDEQLERFYELVADIRAMRAMFKASSSCDYRSNGEDIQRTKRRQVERQPPWRPAFAMEDFRDTVDDSAADVVDLKKARSNGVKEPGPEDKGHEESQVVEEKGVADTAQQSSYKK